MRDKIVLANWKMHGTSTAIDILLRDLLKKVSSASLEGKCAILPPAIYLQQVKNILQNTNLHIGAQNIYPKDNGAYTGEISGLMLQDFGCKYVLVGHSERRTLFNESNDFIAKKFHYAKELGLIPVLCVGETLHERNLGLTEKSLATQILAITKNEEKSYPFTNCIIAYEPIWAIGTGQTATPEEAQKAHNYIRNLTRDFTNNADLLPIVYGGSVNEKNANELFAQPDIDGGLIGGASLDADKFFEIIMALSRATTS
jgi:triosephosphate isomerase